MPPVASSQQRVYCAWPGWILPRSLLSVALTYAAAPGPTTIALPRCETSKMPTLSRTAVCSLTTPEGYSSGIDQPPNSANLAPGAPWRWWSGEVRRPGPPAGEPDGESGLESGMNGTYRSGRPTPGGWLSCPGDVVHPPPSEPRQDPGRRRRRRRRAERPGGGAGPGRGGRRRGVRPQATAAAGDARRQGQA